MTEKTFVRITNREIYEKLEYIDRKVTQTNGAVKMHRKLIWAIGGAIVTLFVLWGTVPK